MGKSRQCLFTDHWTGLLDSGLTSKFLSYWDEQPCILINLDITHNMHGSLHPQKNFWIVSEATWEVAIWTKIIQAVHMDLSCICSGPRYGTICDLLHTFYDVIHPAKIFKWTRRAKIRQKHMKMKVSVCFHCQVMAAFVLPYITIDQHVRTQAETFPLPQCPLNT